VQMGGCITRILSSRLGDCFAGLQGSQKTVTGVPAITDQQRVIGMKAINNLREIFNSAAPCEPFMTAPPPCFMPASEIDWLRACTELKYHRRAAGKASRSMFEQRFGDRLIDVYGVCAVGKRQAVGWK